ncbi:MAG: metallophosphoesterase, partial [Lachnospiraceae bacterium]|nr:metallophosphoesterase [Lachnospiraceae bacterium]
MPISTTIGNHDSTNESYSFHFNNPNLTGLGTTAAGGDYFYKYGPAVFIVLNTNNYNCAEHETVVQTACKAYPDAKWRIVMFHQDIYGSGLDHSDSDGIVLRTQLTPIMDKYDIDVVLQGHDHTYSRSYLLKGDAKAHAAYDFYDWDNVKDAAGNVYPYANEVYQADNNCYTITDMSQNRVVNPEGTLYMESNSSTGSKFYELMPNQQDYIAARSQNWLPSYSVLNISQNEFKIDTYEIKPDGTTAPIDQTFTIVKTR